ncbi:glutathione peroxidase [Crenobacter cavernae]|uniref:Glutathione peroxidase n=1 Tax=Crenobacter cavernae TaxID=2290923 RepID=A0ABY0FF72_9NEIS|nr:glutathione peroxidase [Crenobacter cavernae]RXZ44958.1 glutathione peroxidase [Crenobacter cavernae]
MKRPLLAFLLAVPYAALATCPPVLNHRVPALLGGHIDLCAYQGRPVLVVNTASECGFTPQFSKLEAVYKQYEALGLVVVGFPSNDFHQEKASAEDISRVCYANYGVTFPMAGKVHVTGDDALPFFKALSAMSGQKPRWNFYKYLVSPDGNRVTPFSSPTEPDDPALIKALQPYLNFKSKPIKTG